MTTKHAHNWISAEERIRQINERPNIQFVRWEGEYCNNDSKAVCRCSVDGFEWPARVANLVDRGTGCPQCRLADIRVKLRTPADDRIAQINKLPNISFVRWACGYKNARSKAVCKCQIDGFEWASSVDSLVNTRTGCPQCSGKRRWTAEEQISKINAIPNITFVRWVNKYTGAASKAVCRCTIDGSEWPARVSHLLHAGSGCPVCGFAATADAKRTPEDEIVNKINELPNTTFVRWVDGYTNNRSKAIYRCAVDNYEWSATVGALARGVTGCPRCAKYGYQLAKPGALYVLRSECGTMVKIGVSNDYKTRHSALKRATPFDWHCIEVLHSDDGSLIAEWEKELHSWTEQAIFGQSFSGATEWRKWDDRLPMWLKRYRARLDKNKLERAL